MNGVHSSVDETHRMKKSSIVLTKLDNAMRSLDRALRKLKRKPFAYHSNLVLRIRKLQSKVNQIEIATDGGRSMSEREVSEVSKDAIKY